MLLLFIFGRWRNNESTHSLCSPFRCLNKSSLQCFYSWKWCSETHAWVSSHPPKRGPLCCLAQECTAVSSRLTSEAPKRGDVLTGKTLRHLTGGKDDQEFPAKCRSAPPNDDKMSSCLLFQWQESKKVSLSVLPGVRKTNSAFKGADQTVQGGTRLPTMLCGLISSIHPSLCKRWRNSRSILPVCVCFLYQ